jgi:A/G-specific adenine glycosylase
VPTLPIGGVEQAGRGPAGDGLVASRDEVLAWFDAVGRDLPWRRTRDPWAVLVAEIMLQQTQVARVVEPWARFLAAFPTPAALAGQPVAAAVERWAGLGYNRRAANLHRAATVIVERHDGLVPDFLAGLLALPGVGAYTARAVLVFAFERDEAVLDTNAARVAARVSGRTLAARDAQAMLDAAVPRGHAWAWNQAVLDVGAMCCRPGVPQCGPCPFARHCRWRSEGHPQPDPAVGSAAVSVRQAPLDSDRQGRGRLVAALRLGPVPEVDLAPVMGWPQDPERAKRVVARLVAEGLVEGRAGHYRLAGR